MSKAAYTEEQIKQIIQQVVPALKKRLQEATEELKKREEEVIQLEHELEAKSVLEDENDTLAQQLIRLKAHFQEKIKHLELELEQAKEQKKPEVKDGGVSPELLHREKLQKQALESSLIHLQELLTKAQKERQQAELELNQGKANAVQLERIIAFTREQLDDVQKSHLNLRGEKEKVQQELAKQLEKSRDFDRLFHEKTQCEQILSEKEKVLGQCEREVSLIKQSLLRALKEVKELDGRYEEALKEKATALQKFQQSHLHVEKLRGQVQFLQEQLDLSQTTQHKTQQDLEAVRSQLAIAETSRAVLQEKCTALENGQGEVQGEIHRLKSTLFEKEGDLLQAQQHLAKKVKEAAQLEDKNEELRLFVNELQQVQNQSRVKLAELQTASDYQVNFQKKLEDQHQDLSKAHEHQIAKWEEKYFAVYEKWQSAEARLKELEKLEDKQKQLQGILSSLGTVLNPAGEIPAPLAPIPPPIAPPAPAFAMQIPAKQANTLFDRPKTHKVRPTFLE